MINLLSNKSIINTFKKNQKCIINTDLDGILSGMLLQKFLNWEIVGYSSCCGKTTDELWLKNANENLKECIFIDLPICIKSYSTIDQHFVAFDEESIINFCKNNNKVNPNIMRKKVFKDINGNCEYTNKYPFGTVHFILAILENLNIIDKEYKINFNKSFEGFDLADLILRADRVIGNTYQYTSNCMQWSNWIIQLGGENTKTLFQKVKTEYIQRKKKEIFVEKKLKEFGCIAIDGDCSNLFREKNYLLISKYFNYLSSSIDLNALPIFKLFEYGKLNGERLQINTQQLEKLKSETLKENVFSFAFVNMRTLSLTYIKND